MFDHLEAMRKCNTFFYLENEEQKRENEKHIEEKRELRLEIQSLMSQKDEAVFNRIEDKSNASTRAGILTGDIKRLNDEMTTMKEIMKMQNKTIEDKSKAIERWEKRCGEAGKKNFKLQKEKDTEVRKMANIKKDN